jgi:hypothetical protein
MKEKIEALFKKFYEGTEQDKAEVAEHLQTLEGKLLMYSAEFVRVSLNWADKLGIKKMTDEEAEAYDAALEEPEICPHCGQEMEN